MTTRKITALATLLLASTCANADQNGDTPYIGISIGMTSAKATMSCKTPLQRADFIKIGGEAANYGVHLGYHYNIKESPLFVRLEAEAQSHNMEISQEEKIYPHGHTFASLRSNSSLIGQMKFGVAIKDLNIVAGAGVAHTNWRMKLGVDNAVAGIKRTTGSRYAKLGRVFGFGLDYKINPNWSIGVIHTATEYPALRMSIQAGEEFRMEPKVSVTNMRLTYSF